MRRGQVFIFLTLLWGVACTEADDNALSMTQNHRALNADVTAELVMESVWQSGYCSRIYITNNSSEDISDWSVEINLAGASVYAGWSMTYQNNGDQMTATPTDNNSIVAAGSDTNFGFCANMSPVIEPVIVAFEYNGELDTDTEIDTGDTEPDCTEEVCDQVDNDCDGLVDEANVCDADPRLLIVLSSPVLKTGIIADSLTTYQADILEEGWSSAVVVVNNEADPDADEICQDEVALKDVIIDYYDNGNGIEGILFIGSDPVIPTAYWTYHRANTNGGNNHLPTDLYYMDMEEWVDMDGNGVYETYDSKQETVDGVLTWVADTNAPASPNNYPYSPELFLGRITAGPFGASATDEADMAASYLDKVHAYRENGSTLSQEQYNRALLFQDDHFTGKNLIDFWQNTAPHLEGIYDKSRTNSAVLLDEVEKGYRFIFTAAHASPNAFQTHEWNNGVMDWTHSGDYNLTALESVDVNAHYLHMFNCSANKYTEANLGASYLFNNAHPLNVTGSTGDWGFMGDITYFEDIAAGRHIGVALVEHIQRNTVGGERGWPKGTLQGDPLMTHPVALSNKAPRITTNLTDVTVGAGETLSLNIGTSDPENDSVTVAVVGDMPDNASFDGSTFEFTPDASQLGYQSVEISLLATDSNGNTYSETFAVSVIPQEFLNGDFESGDDVEGTMDFWTVSSWQEADVAWGPAGSGRNGTRSAVINNAVENDTSVLQNVANLYVGSTYRLSGYIKGDNIVNPYGTIGATLGIDGTYTNTGDGLTGTFDWTYVELDFEATDSSMTLGCRLGHWGNTVTGTAWFDDLSVDFISQ